MFEPLVGHLTKAEALRISEQHEREQRQRQEFRAGRVARIRRLLEQLSDDDLQALTSSGGADLLVDAAQPIIVRRGEQQGIVRAAETAASMRPLVLADRRTLEKELRTIERDPALADDPFFRDQRRSAVLQAIKEMDERVAGYDREIEAAKQVR